jgi:hypothetical protein
MNGIFIIGLKLAHDKYADYRRRDEDEKKVDKNDLPSYAGPSLFSSHISPYGLLK